MTDYPSSESPSSVILIILFLLSILCSVYVSCSVLSTGVRTPHASLVLYLNVACICRTVSKFPFVFGAIDHACVIMGPIYWYCAFLMQIVEYLMISSVNLKLIMTTSTPTGPGSPQLDRTTKIFMFVLPAVTIVYPLLTKSYVTVHRWCDVSRGRDSGIISRTIFIAITFVLQVITIYKLIVVTLKLRKLPPSPEYDDAMQKLFRGPGTYPIVGMLLTLVTDAIVIWEHSTRDEDSDSESDSSRYYYEYALLLVTCAFGIVYFIVYNLEKNNIKVNMSPHRQYIYSLFL